jgi:hypothetical protein
MWEAIKLSREIIQKDGSMMNQNIRPSLVVFGVLFASALNLQSVHGGERLRWRFKPGQELRYEFTQTVKMTVNRIQTQKTDNYEMTCRFDLKWTVKSVANNGSATIVQKIERFRIQQTGGSNAAVTYDSAKRGLAVARFPVVWAACTFRVTGRCWMWS